MGDAEQTRIPAVARGRRVPRRALLLGAGLVLVVLVGVLSAVVINRSDGSSCVGGVGFDWPNAGRVYLAGVTQQSTTAADPARPFTVAQRHRVPQVRIFAGVDAAITAWTQNPAAVLHGMDRLLTDAHRLGEQVIISNYPDQPMISALAGHGYPSWGAAQLDLTTPGSIPYQRFGQWLQIIVARFATSPDVASWEVVNEPGYMLGIDDATVTVTSGLSFVEHFADVLHQLGARVVNGGGRPVVDPLQLSDTQLAGYTRHIDVLDDHLYPTGPDPTPATERDAATAVADTARWFDRARRVANRPGLPAMLGEVGSQPSPWFRAVQADATARGWPTFAWAFDAYDPSDFTDTVAPAALQALTAAADHASRINGAFPVQVGTPACTPPR